MKRREFFAHGGAAALMSTFPARLSGLERETTPGGLERRSLGRTGEKLSVLGLGGVVVMNTSTEQAARTVGEAIDAGINYFDVAPSYGNAEDMLGPALEPYRKGVFLACKTQERTRDGANRELESSLGKLRTDHLDLYQLHAVTKLADVDTIFGPGGAIEAFQAARQAGKVRFLGFSAHSVEAAMALMERFSFDTILFPVNFATWHNGDFGPQVLARAQQKQMGILALKAMARGPYPEGASKTDKCWYQPLQDPAEIERALRFTLSFPVTAAIPPGNEELFGTALGMRQRLLPLSDAEVLEIKRMAQGQAPLFRHPSPEA